MQMSSPLTSIGIKEPLMISALNFKFQLLVGINFASSNNILTPPRILYGRLLQFGNTVKEAFFFKKKSNPVRELFHVPDLQS